MVASEVVDALRAAPCGRRLLELARGHDGLWLVGGAVRDIMLGRVPRELDVAVEGELEPLLEDLGGAATAYERFGTASVIDGDCRFDLARTRSETYAAPGRAARRRAGRPLRPTSRGAT